MDISDDELFEATPSCSISTANTSLNLTVQTRDLIQDPMEEKDHNDILTKDISVKVTRLSNAKTKKGNNCYLSKNKKRRYTWKYGLTLKRRKKDSSSKSSKSSTYQQVFQNMESAVEAVPMPSEDKANEQADVHLYNQSREIGDVQPNEQTAQSGTRDFILSTNQAQKEDSFVKETFSCARTSPYTHYRKSVTPSNLNVMECSDSSSLLLGSKNRESSLRSDKFHLPDCLSSNDPEAEKKLINSRLALVVKRTGEQMDEWKFKRKYSSSGSDSEEIPVSPRKRYRRMPSSSESDNEEEAVNNMKGIEDDNLIESHLSHETVDKEKPDIPISLARVVLTRLEEMKSTDVIKWLESKMKPSDTIPSNSEGEQLNQSNLLQNSPKHKENEFLENSEALPITAYDSCAEEYTAKSKLNKLQEKYKLFKKPRVLMIKLNALQCSSKDGKYSAIKIDCETKKYVNFVIKSNVKNKSHGLNIYKHVQRIMMDADTTCMENHNVSPSSSTRHSVNERLEPYITEESSIKDAQPAENKEENIPFKINRNLIRNQQKTSETFEQRTVLSQEHLKIWRNAFRKLMPNNLQKTASMPSTSTSETLPVPRNSSNKSLPSTPTSSARRNISVGSPRNLTSPKKQTEASVKATECNTSKPGPSTRKNLPSETNVKEVSNSFPQSKDGTVPKSPCKIVKDGDVTSNAFLNSSKRVLEMLPELHEAPTNIELSTKDLSVKLKISKKRGQPRRSNQTYNCTTCGASYKNYKLFLKHIANNLSDTCALAIAASKSDHMETSTLDNAIENKEHSQNLENSKPSTSKQQHSSINGEDRSDQSNKSLVGSDMLSSSSSSSLKAAKKTDRKNLKKSQKKVKSSKSTAKLKSNLNLDSPSAVEILQFKNNECNRSTNSKVGSKQNISCKICSQIFDSHTTLLQHMFGHMAKDLRSMYTSIENEISPEHQKSNENNGQVSDGTMENSVQAAVEEVEVARNDTNEQEKTVSENTNELNTESLVAPEVAQQDVTEERNETSDVPATEDTVERDVEKQSTLASNAKQKVDKTRCTDKKEMCIAESSLELQSTKSFTICECHMPKNITNNTMNVQIETVLLCASCQTLFRRLECFEAHCTQRSAKGLCNKSRRHSRITKLLCVNCEKLLNSIEELWDHLIMHADNNQNGAVTFCCNICKVIFYSFGQLFKIHFQNHVKKPFFLASRLSFPRSSYIGTKLVKLQTANKVESLEIYMQIADFVCQQCKVSFGTERSLKLHNCLGVNADIPKALADGKSTTSVNSINKIRILLMCGLCHKPFYSKMSFELHSLEHTKKQKLHLHYTCVTVTAVTKVYICKVCTTMWQSMQEFEEHWKTHGELVANYVCSRCQGHYSTFDLFYDHVITTHKSDNEMQQVQITCEVIYRDIGNKFNATLIEKDITKIPCTDLSYFCNEKNSAEKDSTMNDKSHESQESICLQLKKLGCEKRSTQFETPEPSVSFNKEAARNILQVPVQVPSPSTAVAQSKRSSNDNLENCNDDSEEEDEITIVLSESEESSVSNGVRRNADSTPSSEHRLTQEKTKSTTSNPVIIDKQMQCFNNVPAATSTKTSSSGSESTSSNAQAVTTRKKATQLNTNASVSKDNKTLENCIDHSVSAEENSSKEKHQNLLAKNVMSSVPKSFLRVKSLAELTNTPPEKQLCQICGLSFESRHKFKEHISTHKADLLSQSNKSNKASSSDNKVLPAKPTFDCSVRAPTTSTQTSTQEDRPLPSVVTPSATVRPNAPMRVIDKTNDRHYDVIGVKPLHSDKPNKTADVSKPKETLPHEMTRVSSLNVINTIPQRISQTTGYHQNLPPQVSHPLQKSFQSTQQQQNTGTVAVRPFMQTTNYQVPRPPPPPYFQRQQPQRPQQPSQVQQQSLQLQQQSQLEQSQQQRQQSILQQRLQIQNQQRQQQLQQQQLQQQQPQQQQQAQLQQQQQAQQLQLQQYNLQQQQQFQLQHQQQVNIGGNVMHYVITKTGVSYQLAPSNVVSSNSDNFMLVAVNTMQQISKNPERYVCLHCPGFECNSVNEFALHEHSPKHEARSHYNSIAYVPQT